MSGASSRVAAARVLDAVLHRGRSLKAELAVALPALADPRDRALVEAICFAALRQRARHDAALKAWIAKPLPKRDDELRALLRAGFAQVDALGLPAHAAVAATVEATRAMGRAHQAGMVNALLRRALREGLPEADAADAWPTWLREQLRAEWPGEFAAIIAASAVPASTWLRVNARRVARDNYVDTLREAGIEGVVPVGLADAVRVDASVAVASLPGFATGDVSIQDGAAQLVADALSPARGARVLDACAAPGGKSAHLLERDPSLRLTAVDSDARRLRKVAETLARLQLEDGAVLSVADASRPQTWWDGAPFDAILLDAPCSATGIVRRQPDILLHRRESDLASVVELQARLLDAVWSMLRPGGVLLYATCSILKAENEQQVAAFLARTPDATIDPLDERFGHLAGAGRQRLPGEDGMDGFFYARLRKGG
ncbi:16S rRNA (cytosine967-C5)-methyltransferase [Luteimonas cucumeris]|uniref:16S rRNA (cytosine(967)-C(5))-methyltransferase n=1 Tax=Luteimonas cucumeris TaxID=985012 RepID=A0A562L228_9GAMM|nr:16S rRNA (cytosine(967)-C(5))-methyltransferase RsmB [Luteimonas cucumeris]TWI01683.1 16S rRNA (cytosine967-C5)-methyltransferase [Luteimonas cucumeris]